ncbi:hypothetical protein LCGC14_0746280 [marine sediment metagenome]|uniref:Uncharacterized protein n=1 Tax=marine sediment metagenome TaxID=412755 RepID=A0A0F9TCD7_9ZZZZ
MTLDPFSLALGFVAAYVISTVMFIVLCVMDLRQAKKERDRELDRLLAEVGVACIERPINVRTN